MPVGYSAVSRTQHSVSPVAVVVALMRSTMTWWVLSGRPRQFMAIWENRLAGGRRSLAGPVSAAKAVSSTFQTAHVSRWGRAPAQMRSRSVSG